MSTITTEPARPVNTSIGPIQVQAAVADRMEELEVLATEADDFQCSIASALGWDCKGKPMDQCVRELRAAAEVAKEGAGK